MFVRLLFCVICSLGTKSWSQSIHLKILDSLSKQPIVNADIYILELDQQWKSDEKGDCWVNKYNDIALSVKINAHGYQGQFLTLSPYQSIITISLSPVHIDLHEVTVSSGTALQMNKNPYHIETQKLTTLNAITSLSIGEAMTKISGVYNASSGNGIAKPVIRGMQGMRVVTLLNGLRLEGQQWGGDHGLGVTSLGISAVEVIKGPASLMYGADALGGVVYLVDAPFASINSREFELQSDMFSNTLGGKIQGIYKASFERFRWYVAGLYSNHADFQLPSRRFANNSRFNEFGAKLNMAYTGNKFQYAVRYTMSQSQTGIIDHEQDSLVNPITYQVLERNRKFEVPMQEMSNHLLQFTIHHYREKNLYFFRLGGTYNQLFEFEDDLSTASLNFSLLNRIAQFNWTFRPSKKVNLTSGLQTMLQSNVNGKNATETLIPNADILDLGAYSNLLYNVNNWNLQMGFRLDSRTLFHMELPNQNNLTFIGYNGSLGAVRDFNLWLFRACLSTGFRAPHSSELFSNGMHHGAMRYELGNSKLQSEKASQLDLTFDIHKDHGSFHLNPFVNYIRDYIYLQPLDSMVNSKPVFLYDQKKQVLFSGFDVSYHFHPHFAHGLHWETSFSYIYVHAFRDSTVSLIPQPRVQNNVRFEFSNKGVWVRLKEFNIQSTWMGPQKQVAYLESSSSAYHVLDAALSLSIGKTEPFKVKLGCKNLLDTQYIDHLSRLKNIQMPFPGRNVFLSIAYNFSQKKA